MSKKKRTDNIFESASIESADAHRDAPESSPADPTDAQHDDTASGANPEREGSETNTPEELVNDESLTLTGAGSELTESDASAAEDEPTEPSMANEEASPESSPESDQEQLFDEDLLEDVRRSLIEAESEKEQKDSKWWRRIGKKSKKAEPEQPTAPAEIDLPSLSTAMETTQEPVATSPVDEDVDQLDDLIDLLKSEDQDTAIAPVAAPETEAAVEPAPEPEVDFEELKKQAFAPRAERDEPEPLTDVRSIALEGGEEVLVEVEAKPVNPMEERLSAVENALKPYRQYIYIALAVLGVGMAVFASLIIYRVVQQSRPQPTQPVSNLPFPASVSLPGGWTFQLGRGSLQNGKWEPQGAEWLEGTEICRWVALPWSKQLEAVVRTLNPKDPIDLVMSNNDKFVYSVYSVRQLTPEEMQKLDSNSPCLLIILQEPNVEKRWVLTALP